MAHRLPPEYSARLTRLRTLLSNLPESIPSSEGIYYPFSNFQIDQAMVKETGSPQGAINRTLDITFGSRGDRIASGKPPIVFQYQGHDLECVVDVLAAYLTGEQHFDAILLKWVDDLISSAEPLIDNVDVPSDVLEGDSTGRVRRATYKQDLINQATAIEAARQQQREDARQREEQALARTEFKVNYDPNKLTNVPSKRSVSGKGKKPSPLLDKLTISCQGEKGEPRVRCSGLNCPINWKSPRQSKYVLPHARTCRFLSDDLRKEARDGLRSLAPSAKLAELDKVLAGDTNSLLNSPLGVAAVLKDNLAKKRQLVGEDLLVRCICNNYLPPTLVDSPSFKAYVEHLDSQTKLAHSSTYVKLISAEAEAVLEESVSELVQQTNLTMSFDGASIRGAQSIYTVHVTSPETHEAHLIEGDESSGRSHTATHIKGVLSNVFKLIPETHFAAICSDDASNTKLARELIAETHPHIIVLPDPCHHMHNCAKDICKLDYFELTIHRLRIVIRYFSKSTFAMHHLTVLRLLRDIPCGLVKIGNTRFLSIYYAIHALLPCLQPIRELMFSGVLKIGKTHKLAWVRDNTEFKLFETILRQLHGLLQPFARAVVCLEASASTLGDVYYLWIAAQATLQNLFLESNHLGGLMLPNELISAVRTIVNGRCSQAIDRPELQCYLATFYLNHRYLGSDIFKRKHANPLVTTIKIGSRMPISNAILPSTTLGEPCSSSALFDDDLRRSLPAYSRVGQYLLSLLTNEVNSKRAPHIFDFYDTWERILDDYRTQFIAYTRQKSPFDTFYTTSTPNDYWIKLLDLPEARILAYLAVKLFSIVPNSMAEERTISAFTKLNSPDRGRQKAETVVGMTQVLQREHRIRREKFKQPLTTFREIPGLVKSTDRPAIQDGTDSASLDSEMNCTNSNSCNSSDEAIPSDEGIVHSEEDASRSMEVEAEWESLAGLDETIEAAPPKGSCEEFEAARSDGLDLTNPYLLSVLSDKLLPELLISRSIPSPVAQPVEQIPVAVHAVVVPF